MNEIDNIDVLKAAAEELGCAVSQNVSLSGLTSFKVGGKCRLIIEPCSETAAAQILKKGRELGINLLIMGRGSNLLCDDLGFSGAIILIKDKLNQIKKISDDEVFVQAGCSLAVLCRFCLENSLEGLEFAYGIPGTVGGAIYMNAGAYGGEIKDVVKSVVSVDGDAKEAVRGTDELKLSYRYSVFHEVPEVITSAVFKLKKGNKEEIRAKMDELIGRRKSRQPLEYPSAGSTFKRPPGQFAGKLVEDCGLKGYTVGGAAVSEKHCGFVINKGGATAEDIKAVIAGVQRTVEEKTGFYLECEVKIIPADYSFFEPKQL